MSKSAQVPGGVVTSLQGRAAVIPAGQADARPLQEGNAIQPGDVILAEANTQIQITDASGQAWVPRDVQQALNGANGRTGEAKKSDLEALKRTDDTQSVNETINAVDRGDEDAAAAAGLTGGGDGGGAMSMGLRVDRVIETVSSQEFTYSTPDREAGTPLATAAPPVNLNLAGNPPPVIQEPSPKPNRNPETGNYKLTTDEDKPVSGQVKATDPNGDALTYTKGADPQHGTVLVNADGTWTYTPAKGYNGSDSFTVIVSDGKNGTATATIDIGINPVNDPPKVDDPNSPDFDPVTGHYALTTDEDKPVSGQVKGTDPNGDALTYTKGADPQHGTVLVNADGTWTYTPAKGYNGSDSFTVIVSDGKNGTTTATIDIDTFTTPQGQSVMTETFGYAMADKSGESTSGNITLATAASADNAGHAPLGLFDLVMNPLLEPSQGSHVAVADADNNLVRLDVSVGQLLSLGTLLGDQSRLSLSLDPALTQGLHISGNDSRHLVIESDTPGHTIDVAQVNHLLSTLSYDPAHALGLSVDLFPQLTILATDAAGATASKMVSSSIVAIDVNTPTLASHIEHTVPGSGEHQGSGYTDVFAWTLSDRPAAGEAPQTDTITDFNCAARSAGGDVLDLRDLLQTDPGATTAGAGDVDKLLKFLDFDTHSQPGSTIIHVSASGGFHADASGQSDSTGCADQQHIVLANVDLRASLGLDQASNDHQIISELMNRGKLLVDHC